MSFEAIKAIRDKSQHHGSCLELLIEIAHHHNKNEGYAWPSIDKLADRIGVTRRHALRLLDKLTQSGELRIEASDGRRRDKHYYSTHHYFLPILESSWVRPATSISERQRRATSTPLRDQTRGDIHVTPTNPDQTLYPLAPKPALGVTSRPPQIGIRGDIPAQKPTLGVTPMSPNTITGEEKLLRGRGHPIILPQSLATLVPLGRRAALGAQQIEPFRFAEEPAVTVTKLITEPVMDFETYRQSVANHNAATSTKAQPKAVPNFEIFKSSPITDSWKPGLPNAQDDMKQRWIQKREKARQRRKASRY